MLREKLCTKRIVLDDDQRRRLAVKGKILGRKLLETIGSIFTPDTILRWHRELVARKWNYSDKRKKTGRPATPEEVVELILKFAKENPTWGHDRIADMLGHIGHQVSDRTVGSVLKANGIEPAPKRKRTTTWATFLKAHWNQLAAIDFTTAEVWTTSGLVTYYLLFAMRVATRQVQFLGCTPNPAGLWMSQMARNLIDNFDGFLRTPIRYVLLDRDTTDPKGESRLIGTRGLGDERNAAATTGNGERSQPSGRLPVNSVIRPHGVPGTADAEASWLSGARIAVGVRLVNEDFIPSSELPES